MATVHMMVGIPGSGKSTYSKNVLSKEIGCRIVTSDGVRMEHPDWDETLVWPEVYRRVAEELSAGRDVIYDATSPTPKVRARFFTRLNELIPDVSFEVGVYYFPTPAEICYKRIEKRNQVPGEHFFPLDQVESYASTIVVPTLEEGFTFVKKIITYENEAINQL